METVCPHCGGDVPRKATACPHCGTDEKTGGSDPAGSDGLDLPDDSFDYDDFVKREFGGTNPVPRGISGFWWLMAVIVLGLFVWLCVK